jgi:hypothetical protein
MNNIQYYPIEKFQNNKKNEKTMICTETYIFNITTLNTIIQELYKMEIAYDMNVLDKQITLANINKETANINKEKEIAVANINKEKEIDVANINKEKENIILETRRSDIEYIKLQIELTKLNKQV